MTHLGLALARDGLQAALLDQDRPVRTFSFPARFGLFDGSHLDFVWAARAEAFSLADVERHVRDPQNQATFFEGLLARVLLDLAAAGATVLPAETSLAIGLEHRAGASLLSAAAGAGRRTGFASARAIFLHEAVAASALAAHPAETAHASVEVGARRVPVRIEKRVEAGRVRLHACPRSEAGPAASAEVLRLEPEEASRDAAVGLASLAASGDPPISREWVYALSLGGADVHFAELVPVGETGRRVAFLPVRSLRPAYDPVLTLLAGLAPGLPADELLTCGSQAVNKWVLEDNGGRLVAFLEVEADGAVHWGHLFPRTLERLAAGLPAEALAS